MKGKLSSMPSNCAKTKYCSPDVPWEEAQKLMVIKLSKMGVSVNTEPDLSYITLTLTFCLLMATFTVC